MANPHSWIDVTSAPIIVWTCPEIGDRVDGAAYVTDVYEAWHKWLLAHPRPFVAIIDTSHMKSFPGAKTRKSLAEGEQLTARLETTYNKGNAFVVTNPVMRSIMTAVYWLSSPHYPHSFFGTFADALDWAGNQLVGAGIALPTSLPMPHPPPPLLDRAPTRNVIRQASGWK